MIHPDDSVFLSPYSSTSHLNKPGLTKREYFAAMAMQGFCSYESKENILIEQWEEKWAKTACRIADALIAELSKA